MGKRTPADQDAAAILLAADLAGAAATAWFEFEGTCNVAVFGAGTGSVIIEKSFDGGATAIPLTNLGVAITFTGPATEVIFNREDGCHHRFRRTVATAGTMSVRASQ